MQPSHSEPQGRQAEVRGAVWGAVLGTVLPVVFFRVRAAGNQFWMHDFRALWPIGGAATITGAFSGWLSVLVWRASGRMESPALRWLLRLGTLIGIAVLGLMVGLAWVMVLYWVHALPEGGEGLTEFSYSLLLGLIGSVIGLVSGACVVARGRSR